MKFIATLTIFLGYVLVYAAVANGGEFYATPLAGLVADAYDVGESSNIPNFPQTNPNEPTTSSPKAGKIPNFPQKPPQQLSGSSKKSSGGILGILTAPLQNMFPGAP